MEKIINNKVTNDGIWHTKILRRAGVAIRRLHEGRLPIILYAYAFLFMYTGVDKVQNTERFINGIKKIPLVGPYAELIGWGIPILEILLAIMMIIPFIKTQRWALWTSTGLMGIFCIYVGMVVFFVENNPCNCGGVIESMGWKAHLIFNIIWLAAGIDALRKNNKLQILKINKS